MHSWLHNFDQAVSRQLSILPSRLQSYIAATTWCGSPVAIVAFSLGIIATSYYTGQINTAWLFILGLVAMAGNSLLKHLLRRPRPDTIYVKSMTIKSYSFPSGHTFGATVLYGLLIQLAWFSLTQPLNVIVAVLLTILILLVGISRVILGAHFPSDVLAGWLLGIVALALISLV